LDFNYFNMNMETEINRVERLKSEIKELELKIIELKEIHSYKRGELRRLTAPKQEKKVYHKRLSTERTVIYNPSFIDPVLNTYLHVPVYNIGKYRFEVNSRMLFLNGQKTASLTQRETNLLVMLAANINVLLERNFVLKTIWQEANYLNSRSMDVYLCKVRKLLLADPNINIVNQHGSGFKLVISK